jgi:S-ribosylhomocysteine lyase LuxS involved in autoinducer biosynthesis
MNKKLIRLTESDLHRIVKESVKRILRENKDTNVKVRIIHDPNGAYDDGDVDDANNIIQTYLDTSSEEWHEEAHDWLLSLPAQEAVDYILNFWGIQFEFV